MIAACIHEMKEIIGPPGASGGLIRENKRKCQMFLLVFLFGQMARKWKMLNIVFKVLR